MSTLSRLSPGCRQPRTLKREMPMGDGRLLDVWYPPNLRFPRHDHEHSYVCVTLEGAFEQSRLGTSERHHAGDLALYRAGETHQGRFGPQGSRIFHIELPHGSQELWPETLRQKARANGTAAALAAQLRHLLCASALVEALELEALSFELTLACFGVEPPAIGPSWVRRLQERLRESLAQPVTLRALAQELGLHPSHVAREFRRHTGTTLGRWLRRLRCVESARLLAETDEPLAMVAARCGFSDQSHMGRVFRSLLGTTPLAYRRARRT